MVVWKDLSVVPETAPANQYTIPAKLVEKDNLPLFGYQQQS